MRTQPPGATVNRRSIGGGYYYGSSWSYYYPGPYYGGPYYTDGGRLPYVCGLYGYCF